VFLRDLAPDADLAAVDARRRSWLAEPPPHDDASALRRLAAEDVSEILAAVPATSPRIAAWAEPREAIRQATDAAHAALGALGIDTPRPAVHVRDGVPAPYDHPSLAGISADASDAARFGLAPGIHLDARRLLPYFTETVIGHVLVHAALGERSPDMLGRGFEEGPCELLGALHAASAVIGRDAAAATFRTLRLTPALLPHREAFLAQVRAAAAVHGRHGLAALAQLVREGRPGIKRAEAALLAGRIDDLALARSAPDPELRSALEDLLMSRGYPLAVRPLAFYLTRGLQAGRTVSAVAADLGVPEAAAREAALDLMNRAFVLVLSPDGEVLVDDLRVVAPSGGLRYDIPANLL
jgi:hypothetical protein